MREEILTHAADWLLRLRDPAVTQAEIDEWMSWCNASPQNKAAFAEMQQLWQATGAVTEQCAIVEAGDEPSSATDREPARASRRWLRPALATAAVVVAALIVEQRFIDPRQGSSRDVVVATSIGVNRNVALPDGSRVTIAAGSRLATRYTRDERHVFLESGEAFFQVQKDSLRPFVVHALGSTVTAVGTAFNVRAEEGTIRVAVTDGTVDVSNTQQGTANRESIRVRAGHQVVLSRSDPDPIIVSADTARATSWLQGTLQFADEPLSSVVAAVNRYSARPIVLADPAVGANHYTGTVVAGRVDEWLQGLPNVFPIEVHEQDGRVRLEPAP